MGSDAWVQTCTQVEKDYRKKRDENLSVQRVQVRTAIDRWIQEALPSENQPMEQWKERAYDTIPLLQLGIRDSVPPRLRNAIAQDLVRAVDDVSRSQQDMVNSAPHIGLDVVAPAVLSLAAGLGVVRGVVLVLDYSGVNVHGSWWILAAVVVGFMFMGIVAMLRYRQHQEKIRNLLVSGIRGDMNRRVEELMAHWFFASIPFDELRSQGFPADRVVPRRVALILKQNQQPQSSSPAAPSPAASNPVSCSPASCSSVEESHEEVAEPVEGNLL